MCDNTNVLYTKAVSGVLIHVVSIVMKCYWFAVACGRGTHCGAERSSPSQLRGSFQLLLMLCFSKRSFKLGLNHKTGKQWTQQRHIRVQQMRPSHIDCGNVLDWQVELTPWVDASGEFPALRAHLNVYERVCGWVCSVLRRTVFDGVLERAQRGVSCCSSWDTSCPVGPKHKAHSDTQKYLSATLMLSIDQSIHPFICEAIFTLWRHRVVGNKCTKYWQKVNLVGFLLSQQHAFT